MSGVLLACFFLSGLAGLIYQVVWLRWLILLFGATTLAISTILTAFMGGLALGSFVAGRAAHRVRRPFMAYGLLELSIGAFALVLPALIPLGTPLLTRLTAAAPSFALLSLGRFALVTAVLLFPTACMGATLPLLAQHVSRSRARLGWHVGALYGANTLGAVVGTAAAGFLLLPWIGVGRTNLAAAAVNLVVGLTALVAGRRAAGPEPGALPAEAAGPAAEAGPTPATVGVLLFAIAASGFAAMLYEVAWSRALALVLGSSVYAFTVMLTTFLVGLAAGSLVMARWVDRLAARGPALALVQVNTGLVSFVGALLIQELPFLFVTLFRRSGGHHDWILVANFLIAGLILLAPTLLLGAVFPLVVRMVTDAAPRVGRLVGNVYATNTIGAILGSFAGGFLLVPAIGIQNTLLAAVVLNVLLGALLLGVLPGPRSPLIRAAAVLLPLGVAALVWIAPRWDPMIMSSGVAVYAPDVQARSRREFVTEMTRGAALRYHREGLSTTVTVWEAGGDLFLRVNGKTDASSSLDMLTQVLSGHLPLLLAERAEDVLVIGLASGVTVGAVTRHAVQRITVVELEDAIREASHLFDHVNHRPLADPRTRLVVNDGRNFLLTSPGTYDVIVSEPSNPWMTGASNLFTRDFFELGRARLRPGGVFCQWLQLYGMDPAMLRSLTRTFQAVFPHVLVFQSAPAPDLLLVGSGRPLRVDPADLARRFRAAPVAADLGRVAIERPEDVLGRLLLGPTELAAFAGRAPLNTDDNALIEFAAPRMLYRNTAATNLAELARSFRGLGDVVSPPPPPETVARIGERYLRAGLRHHAATVADEALARADSAPVRALRGRLLLEDGREAEALEELRRAVALDPREPGALEALVEQRLGRGDLAEARRLVARARAGAPDDPLLAYLAGRVHYEAGEYRETVQALARIPDGVVEAARHRFYLGVAHLRLGEAEAARQALGPYVAANAGDALARYALGAAEFQLGALADATEEFTRGVSQRRREAETLVAQAEALGTRGEPGRAVDALRAAVERDPLNAAVRRRLALLLEAQGRDREAIEAWTALLARAPGAREAHRHLADLWERAGDRARARDHLRRFLDGERDPGTRQRIEARLAKLG